MSERSRKILIYATLPLALIWAAFNWRSAPQQTPPAAEVPVIETGGAVTTDAVAPKVLIDIAEITAAPWGSDPFRSYRYRHPADATKTKAALAWILSGVIHSNNEPIACINKKTVRVGDTVDEATVVAIGKTSVTLEYKGRQLKVAVGKG